MSNTVLSIVQKHFPNVTNVKDATKNLSIEVTASDEKNSKRRNHEECAMAVACKRAYKADGVIIARSVAYLVKDKLAIRFKIPSSVGREITSFDRGAGFMPGIYHLAKPARTLKEYRETYQKTKKKGGPNKPNRDIQEYHHMTTGIRTVLGGQDAKV